MVAAEPAMDAAVSFLFPEDEQERLLNENSCLRQEVFATDALSQQMVPAPGMFFYIGARTKNIQVTGVEMAIRSDFVPVGTNLGIKVYASDEKYDETGIVRSQFTKIVDTQLIPHPSDPDRTIIPSSAWTPMTIGRLTRKTLYFEAEGAWIDYTRRALTNAKEQAFSSNRMVLFAGSLVEDTSTFPVTLETQMAPIFSGRFHVEYERDSCTNSASGGAPRLVQTALELVHITNTTLNSVDYGLMEEATNAKVDELLADPDSVLKQFRQDFELSMPESSTAKFRKLQGSCPDPSWNNVCNYAVVELTLKHEETLDAGTLKTEFFKHWHDFSTAITAPFDDIPGSKIGFHYLGYEAVKSGFTITLQGVPDRQTMDDGQLEFFTEQVKDHLNSKFSPVFAEAFTVTVDQQDPQRRRQLVGRRELRNALQLSGVIEGGQVAALKNADFSNRIQEAFSGQGATDFTANVLYNMHLPGPMSQNQRFTFFEDLSSISTSVTALPDEYLGGSDPLNPIDNSTDLVNGGTGQNTDGTTDDEVDIIGGISDGASGLDTWMWGAIGGGVAVLVLLLCCLRWLCMRDTTKRMERKPKRSGRTLPTQSMGASVDDSLFTRNTRRTNRTTRGASSTRANPATVASRWGRGGGGNTTAAASMGTFDDDMDDLSVGSLRSSAAHAPTRVTYGTRPDDDTIADEPAPSSRRSRGRSATPKATSSPRRSAPEYTRSAPPPPPPPPPAASPSRYSGGSPQHRSPSPQHQYRSQSPQHHYRSQSPQHQHRSPYSSPRKTNPKPRHTRSEFMGRSIKELKGYLPPGDNYQPAEKADLLDHLVRVGAIEFVASRSPSPRQRGAPPGYNRRGSSGSAGNMGGLNNSSHHGRPYGGGGGLNNSSHHGRPYGGGGGLNNSSHGMPRGSNHGSYHGSPRRTGSGYGMGNGSSHGMPRSGGSIHGSPYNSGHGGGGTPRGSPSKQPRFRRDELESMGIKQLKSLLPPGDDYHFVEKADLINHLVRVGAVRMVVS